MYFLYFFCEQLVKAEIEEWQSCSWVYVLPENCKSLATLYEFASILGSVKMS